MSQSIFLGFGLRALSGFLCRTLTPCDLMPPTEMECPLTPSSHFPQAPGTTITPTLEHYNHAKVWAMSRRCPLTGTALARSLPWLSCGSSWLWPCSGSVWGRETIWNSQGRCADFPSWCCVQREACGCTWNLWAPEQENHLEERMKMWKQVNGVYLPQTDLMSF